VTPSTMTSFFENVKLYKKSMHLVQMQFIQDLLLMIIKGYMSLFVVENLLVEANGVSFIHSSTIFILHTTLVEIGQNVTTIFAIICDY
jgi:hypothetical protein